MSNNPFRTQPAPDDWESLAACRGMSVELFFPEITAGHLSKLEREHIDAAKEVCRTCPVRIDCHQAHQHERYGVWGGTSEIDRRQKATA